MRGFVARLSMAIKVWLPPTLHVVSEETGGPPEIKASSIVCSGA